MSFLKRVTCIMFAALLIVSMLSLRAFAEEETDPFVSGGFSVDKENIPMVSFKSLSANNTFVSPRHAGGVVYPVSYNSIDKGYITSVKRQGIYGTCWAHGAAASAEASLIKNNNYTDALNISELHLAYYQSNNAYDPLNMLAGDKTFSSKTSSMLDTGGSNLCTPFMFARWTGAVDEDTNPDFAYGKATNYFSSDSKNAYDKDMAHLEDSYWVACEDVKDVKYMIMEYGAGTVGYYYSDRFYNRETGAYFYNGRESTNHEVTVVGWDDNYDKSNFKIEQQPKNNGAWLIKNSWGADWGKQGYFWLSYEDTSLCDGYASFYSFGKADNFDNNYQYDGSNYFNFEQMTPGSYFANVFTADSSEDLKAVGFFTCQNDVDYSIQVYKNLNDPSKPNSGTPVLKEAVYGNEVYPGYHTVRLSESIPLAKNTKYAVVINMTCNSEDTTDYLIDKTDSSSSWLMVVNATAAGQSFYKPALDNRWTDKSALGVNYRIKAFTDEAATEYVSENASDSDGNLTTDTSSENNSEPQMSGINYEKISDTNSLRNGDKIVLLDESSHMAVLPKYADGKIDTLAAQKDVNAAGVLSYDAHWSFVLKYNMFFLENSSSLQLAAIDSNKAYLDMMGSAIKFQSDNNGAFTLSTVTGMSTRYLSYGDDCNGYRFYASADNAAKFSIYRAVNPSVNYASAVDETGTVSRVNDIASLQNGDVILMYNKANLVTITTQAIGKNMNTLAVSENVEDVNEVNGLSLWTVIIEKNKIFLSDLYGNRMTALDDNAVTLTKEGSALDFEALDNNTFSVSSSEGLERTRYLKFNRSVDGYRFYASKDISSVLEIYKFTPTESTETDTGVKIGDLNADKSVDMFDVVVLQRLICDLVDGSEATDKAADVDKDGEITMQDVVMLQRFIAKLCEI